MVDFSFLSQPAQLQLPDPMAMAIRGQTLANLAQQNRENDLSIQAKQQSLDDQKAVARVFADAQTLGWDAAMNKAVQEGNARGAQLGLAVRRADENQQADLKYKGAQTAEATAKGNQANAGALKENLVSIGNHAANLLEQAKAGQIDPWKAVGAVSFSVQKAGLDPQMFGFNANVPGNDPNAALAMLQSVAGNALSAADRIKLPSEVALNTAKAGEANATAGLRSTENQFYPQKIRNETTQANAAASQAATHRLDVMTPKVDISEATGLPYAVDRFAQGGPTVNPIAGAPQMKTTAMQKDLASQTVQEIGNLRASAQAAIQGQQAVKSLQEQEAKGIYSGGIQGTETFKTLANIYAATPGANKAVVDQLANTQAWDAKSGELVATMVKQLGGNRVTNNELNFIRNVKPNTLQTPEGRAQMYSILNKSFQNAIDTADQAEKYVQQPGVYTLSGFRPQYTSPQTPVSGSSKLLTAPPGSGADYVYTPGGR